MTEPKLVPLDGMAAHVGATVLRRSRADVEREMDVAEETAVATQRQAGLDQPIGTRLREAKDALKESFGAER